MLHSVARTIVGCEVQQKCVILKLWWSPHRDFRSHDLLHVFHERGTLAAFRAERVDHDVVPLSVNLESIDCPVRTDLRRRVDENVPVWKIPTVLAGTISAAIDDLPTRWSN